jgi:type I restriction-modification system DNA methylase subunit
MPDKEELIEPCPINEEKQKATLKLIELTFGYKSSIFIESFGELSTLFGEVKNSSEIQVSFEQWKKFLSIAYCSYDSSEENFLSHTYLSVFLKLLAYSVISNDGDIADEEMKKIINGSVFPEYNILNFVNNDFFNWISSENNITKLRKMFRLIAKEISNFDLNKIDEDILKGIYREMVERDTLRVQGENYTPSWLCERIVNEFEFKEGDKILDPICGSGSFLIAVIHKFKKTYPGISAEALTNNIYGIDIHPLSVQIAKTTLLLSLWKDIAKSHWPVTLNIILANSLLLHDGEKDLFGSSFKMIIDKEELILNSQVLDDDSLFDEALETCADLACQTYKKNPAHPSAFANILKNRHKKGGFNPLVIESFYKIYLSLKSVRERGQGDIWKFIIQNLYKPYFLSGKFDYVTGTPPWFNYGSVRNEQYKGILNQLAEQYNIKPAKEASYLHLEIAAVFMAYCSTYYLKENGKLSFVLPRSFFSAEHHNNTRSGKAKGFRLTGIWDLNDITPLFRIPGCVLFAEKANEKEKRDFPASGIKGTAFSGSLKKSKRNLNPADTITEEEKRWYYNNQRGSSAFSLRKSRKYKPNPYKTLFREGATIVPRTFYFIEPAQVMPSENEERIINIKTSEAIQTDAKVPWKGTEFSGQIERQFLFRTALAKSILPFALYKPDLIILPAVLEENRAGEKEIKLYSAHELMIEGYLYASLWFNNVENIWEIHRTEKNKENSARDYINWQNKLTSQKMNSPYLVIYNGTGSNATAVVIKRSDIDLEFIVDYKSYVFYTDNINEAYYLSSILNSRIVSERLKDFEPEELVRGRDLSKKIFDIYYPPFDRKDPDQIELVELSKAAHQKAARYLFANPQQQGLSAVHLGRLRSAIRKHLSKEIAHIDTIVQIIIT